MNREKEFKLEKLTKKQLIEYLKIEEVLSTAKPYWIIHNDIGAKTKYEITIKNGSTRFEIIKGLFGLIKTIIKTELI